jgi:hypothetical protein
LQVLYSKVTVIFILPLVSEFFYAYDEMFALNCPAMHCLRCLNHTAQNTLRFAEDSSPENSSPENSSPENSSPDNFSPEHSLPENYSLQFFFRRWNILCRRILRPDDSSPDYFSLG